jgi:tRNA 2-thiocytidine biosynthesis protein TtcA
MFSPVESNQGFNFKPELPTSSAYYRLLKKLRRQVGHAIRDFKMIEEGDKVMVCISGGKDSYTLLDILLQFKRIAPINFDIVAVNLDQKQPGFPEDVLPRYMEENNIPYYILEKDTYTITKRLTPEWLALTDNDFIWRWIDGEDGFTEGGECHHRAFVVHRFKA